MPQCFSFNQIFRARSKYEIPIRKAVYNWVTDLKNQNKTILFCWINRFQLMNSLPYLATRKTSMHEMETSYSLQYPFSLSWIFSISTWPNLHLITMISTTTMEYNKYVRLSSKGRGNTRQANKILKSSMIVRFQVKLQVKLIVYKKIVMKQYKY